jgi:ubiquinone/menaquinone biosynthesis C-methylase UbiE
MAKNYLSVEYDENHHPFTEYPQKLCSYLFQSFQLKAGMKMLEPGCGRGEFLNNFKDLGLDVFGVDISSEAVRLNQDLDIKLCDVDRERLPFDDNIFDVILSKSFIEHLNYPEKYFEEAYRVLKPNGILISLVPDWESNYKIYFDDFTHRSPFSNISLAYAYKMYDFKEVEVFKFRQLPIVWKFPILNYLCSFLSPFIPVRTQNKFLRWSRELMLVGFGRK